jgi:methyl-accepting chemotaxis protein/ribose transport system substrate-binding protein
VAGIETYIEKANRKNVQVVTFNCDLPDGVKRLAYFGPDVAASGTMAGELLLKCIEGSGEVAIFRGGFAVTINKIRRDTVIAALQKKKKVRIVAELEAIHDTEVYERVKEVLHDFPNLEGIIIVGGHVRGAAKAIEELGRVGKTKIVCFDTDQEVMELINKGIIYAAMGQDPFGQGHDPIISLYNYLAANVQLKDINYTRNQVVDIRNASK